MAAKRFLYFLFLLKVIYCSAIAMEDKPLVTYSPLEIFFSITQDDQTALIRLASQEEYNSLIDSKFSWLREKGVFPIKDQKSNLDPLKTIYLDTHWEAITSETSKYPILATSYLYNCVGFILMSENSRRVGLYHIYPDDLGERIEDYVLKFMEHENVGQVRSILLSGRISDNLSRCYEILKKKSIQSIRFHVLEIIEEGNTLILNPSMFPDIHNFEINPQIIRSFIEDSSFLSASIEARTMELYLVSEVQINELISGICELHGDLLQRTNDAFENGIHVRRGLEKL